MSSAAARLLKYNPVVNYGAMATFIGSSLAATGTLYYLYRERYLSKHAVVSATKEWAASQEEAYLHKARQAADPVPINVFRHWDQIPH